MLVAIEVVRLLSDALSFRQLELEDVRLNRLRLHVSVSRLQSEGVWLLMIRHSHPPFLIASGRDAVKIVGRRHLQMSGLDFAEPFDDFWRTGFDIILRVVRQIVDILNLFRDFTKVLLERILGRLSPLILLLMICFLQGSVAAVLLRILIVVLLVLVVLGLLIGSELRWLVVLLQLSVLVLAMILLLIGLMLRLASRTAGGYRPVPVLWIEVRRVKLPYELPGILPQVS